MLTIQEKIEEEQEISTGKYHWNLFSDDMFDGQIFISDFKITQN